MANLTYAAETVFPGRSMASAFRRMIGQWQAFRAHLAEESAVARRDHRLRRLVRRMDRRQLQDIGLDRNRC
jgi:uncharacterized protein YjiS (DUF1127 family)